MKTKLLYTIAILFATLQTFAQTYTYDNLNRLTKVVYDNGTTITYSYDALGNRLSKKVTGATSITYTISTNVSPAGSGTVTGGGSYAEGASVELNAIANAGYEFSKWSDGETANPRTITVTKDMTYTAQFIESGTTPDLLGDIVVDGKVNQQDLDALVDVYLNNTQATKVTDLDGDGSLTILDITKLISIMIKPQAFNGQIAIERKYLVHNENDYCYHGASYRLNNGIQVQIRYHDADYWQGTYDTDHHGIYIAVGRCEDLNADWEVDGNDWFEEWYIGPVVTDEWVDEKIIIDDNGTVQYFMNGENKGKHQFSMLTLDGANTITLDYSPYGWWTGHHHYMDNLKLTLPNKTISDNFNDGVIDTNIWQTPSNPEGVREEDGILKMEQVKTDWPYHLRSHPILLGNSGSVDYTSYITNPAYDDNNYDGWLGTSLSGYNPDNNAEHYEKNYDTYQTITNLAPGKYRVGVQGFYRRGSSTNDYTLWSSGSSENNNAVIYAESSKGSYSVPFAQPSSAALSASLGGEASSVGNGLYIPNNMVAAGKWFDAGYYHNYLNVEVGSDGKLTIGIKKDVTITADWTIIDNWTLTRIQ